MTHDGAKPLYVVLLGPPGAGKGTQARLLSQALGIPHVASGELFREHVEGQTELGRLAQSYMDRGELVPDEVTIRMVMERLDRPDCADGAILDGFPRTVAQAEALAEAGTVLDRVVLVDVPEDELVRRLSGRRTCPSCGAMYHVVSAPPRQPGICDACGATLVQRDDDQEATIRRRLQVYRAQTEPVAAFYRERGVLEVVDGTGTPDEVLQRLLDVVEAR